MALKKKCRNKQNLTLSANIYEFVFIITQHQQSKNFVVVVPANRLYICDCLLKSLFMTTDLLPKGKVFTQKQSVQRPEYQ